MLVVDTYNVLHTTGVLPPDLAGLDTAERSGVTLPRRERSVRLDRSTEPAAAPGVDPKRRALVRLLVGDGRQGRLDAKGVAVSGDARGIEPGAAS